RRGARAAAAPADGRLPVVVIGEDVVVLVAAAPQPAHVRSVPVAILDLRLGLEVLLVVVVILLGEAEVHECAVPGIPETHIGACSPGEPVSLQMLVIRRAAGAGG